MAVYLMEGTRYDKQAAKIISDSGLFSEEVSANIIDALFHEDIHAFVHSPNWLEKYLKGIARMLVEYANGDKARAKEFLENSIGVFDQYLTWVKENREKIGNSLDTEFVQNMSYQDVVDRLEEIQDELDKQSKDELANMEFNNSNFELVPIESFDEFNSKFGGRATGDGSSDKFAGGGGTAWCHANSPGTYDTWTRNGDMFFVLANKNWKDIPFNEESNKEDPKDDYGNSLIALRISPRTGKLINATLRCNHVGVSTSADNQYKTYAELSKIAGFNVEEEVNKYLEQKGTLIDMNPENLWKSFDGTTSSLLGILDVLEINKSELTEANIPNGVVRLSNSVFSGCTDLRKVTMPDTVTDIESYAFGDCKSLTDIKLSNNLQTLYSDAFNGCTSLTSIEIPDSVTDMGSNVFLGCTSLKSAKLPANLKVLEEGIFYGCTSLEQVTLPENLETLDLNVFAGCKALKSIELPDSLAKIDTGVFKYCTSLESVKLPDTLAKVSAGLFYKCISLTSIEIPAVEKIGDYAFFGCKALTNASISNGVTEIGESTFENCLSLEKVVIPDSVVFIDECAFQSCINLTSVVLSKGLKEIHPSTFEDCKSLTSIEIPEGVERIDAFAFSGCENLSRVKIPNSVTSIGGDAFADCPVTIETSNSSVIDYCIRNNIRYK